MKILFWLYDPNWTQGGTMVMHLFSKMLCDLGEDVYATLTGSVLPGNKTKIISQNDASIMAQNDDVVTVYPEVVVGNPLNAKNVIRWVLYYPGGHGVGDINYDPSELVFPYFDRYVKGTKYENCPLLTIVETRVDQFYPKGIVRDLDCILIKKSKHNFENLKQKYITPIEHLLDKPIIILDNILHQFERAEQLNDVFNRVRYFISFDQASYFNIMSSLAGCTSIVLPIDGLSKEQWNIEMPLYRYGVAYGFDNIPWVEQSREQLKNMLIETEEENLIFAKRFLEIVNSRFYAK